MVMLLRVEVTRWVADEPQPGTVRLRFVDIFGKRHAFTEKCAIVDDRDRLTRSAKYPIDANVACRVHHSELHNRKDLSTRLWVDLSPWGVSGPEVLYAVSRDALTWAPPADLGDLSVCARQAVALVTFRRWRRKVKLDSPLLDDLEDHLWQFATVTPDTFDAWYESNELAIRGPRDELPRALTHAAESAAVDVERLSALIDALTRITYGGLFGGIYSAWSLADLADIHNITRPDGVALAAPDDYVDSLWVDGDWGRPSEAVVQKWRRLSDTT